MKPDRTTVKKAAALSWIVAGIMALLPFHAFLTVWFSSLAGHYTLVRLWKEILLAIIFAGVVYTLIKQDKLRKRLFDDWLIRWIVIYTILLLVAGISAYSLHAVTGKALAYGELVDLRFLVFFVLVLVVSACSPLLRQNWKPIILWPAVAVIVFGLLQYWLLPYDFLRHFGYGTDTISPYETINHNLNYLRIESTLRGANPLGAYLVLITTLCAALFIRAKNSRLKAGLLLAAGLVTLALTFSRSAWIGAALSLAIVLWVSLKSDRLRQWALGGVAVLIVVGAALGLALRHNTTIQNDFLHTDNQSKSVSSNYGHNAAFRSGLSDIYHQSSGAGVGTAGPASVYNNQPARIAENYFLQIGQEAGVVGMIIFILINVLVGMKLWRQRADPLALALFASLIGLSFVNMLSHAWTDDTLAYIWWGLAAIALSPAILEHKDNKNGQKAKAES